VLLVTAFGREEALQASEGLGLAGVINKPVTPSTLLDTLGRALGQNGCTASAQATTLPLRDGAQRALAGAKVLLVEDQPMNQELARALLERAGLSVVTAANGQECLDKLASCGPFDGVLMDCQMPIMDGYMATERIRANPAWADLPVIAMTASAMVSDRERVLQCGMNDHIAKPLDLEQLFNTMARWITPSRPAIADDAQHITLPGPAWSPLSLDTTDGLKRCMGNTGLYHRLLKSFARTQSPFAQRYEAVATDTIQALALVHELKGLAGNIGAHTLLARCSALEASLHGGSLNSETNNDRQNTLLVALITTLNAVLHDIDQMEEVSDNRFQTNGPNADALQKHWAHIGSLVADQDAQAREQLHQLLGQWATLRQRPQVMALKQALDRYDFDAAAEALGHLQQG
jgi:two-component system sensor histidine kinase/response regulator